MDLPQFQNALDSLTETQQTYIETIYGIIIEKNGVRVKDIAREMSVKNSSVVSALRSLAKDEYINYEPYGIISLTKKGNYVARQLTEKHRVLRSFFERVLGLNRDTADDDACRIEHSISKETILRLTQFVKYIYVSSEKDPGWLEGFKDFYIKNPITPEDADFIDEYFEDVGGLSAG